MLRTLPGPMHLLLLVSVFGAGCTTTTQSERDRAKAERAAFEHDGPTSYVAIEQASCRAGHAAGSIVRGRHEPAVGEICDSWLTRAVSQVVASHNRATRGWQSWYLVVERGLFLSSLAHRSRAVLMELLSHIIHATP